MKLLTKERIRVIITDFINNCESEAVKKSGFDESFWETTSWCEETWEDDNSQRMIISLIDNYLLQFGYHYIAEEKNALSQEELIMNYVNRKDILN